jgi:hypothetical protein
VVFGSLVSDGSRWLSFQWRLTRGSENKIPIVAAVSLNEVGHPIYSRITAVSGFSSEAISDWAKRHLAPGSHVFSDGLACFRAVTTANCHHKAVVTGGKRPNDLPQFRWINTLLGNLKTSFSGTFHAFNFDKYARRYMGGYCFRFNRRFSMSGIRADRQCRGLIKARNASQGTVASISSKKRWRRVLFLA